MLGALCGLAAAIAVLFVSNEQPTKDWSVQPTVYLAIASAATNILLHLALAEAVNVAWWRRATQQGTKVADLHRYWSFGNSLWAAMISGRHFNLVALACILVALVPVNGPLLQRASRIRIGHFSKTTTMSIEIAQTLPHGYTGLLSGRSSSPSLMSSSFTQTMQTFSRQAPINVTASGCTGDCMSSVKGAGFAVNCSTSTEHFSITPIDPAPGESFDVTSQPAFNGTLVFGSFFSWGAHAPGKINLGVQYKDRQACDGELQIRNCTFQAAVVEYPVVVNGNKSTISLAPGSTMFDDKVHNLTEVALNTMSGPTTLGGFYKALRDTYASTANLRFTGSRGYEVLTTGATSNRYAVLEGSNSDSDSDNYLGLDCSLFFTDPSNDIIAAVRDMMFRTAISAANSSDYQSVTAQETSTLPVYESSYLYLGLAVLFTALGWLAVFPVFIGWWHVGRTVTMSPIETAKAFGAPKLRNSDSNADAEALLKEIGHHVVRYGATTTTGGISRLEMNDPQFIRTPQKEELFAG